mgnify:CR=1 FL=1
MHPPYNCIVNTAKSAAFLGQHFFEIVFCLDPVHKRSVYDTGQTNYNLGRYGGAGRILHFYLNRIILSRETIRFISR